jgi:hypothetical protein
MSHENATAESVKENLIAFENLNIRGMDHKGASKLPALAVERITNLHQKALIHMNLNFFIQYHD